MHIVVVGGGYAGLTAALRLSHTAKRAQQPIEITLVNEADHFVERIRLHQVATGQKPKRHLLKPLLDRAGIRLIVGRVNRIEPTGRTITVGEETVCWDRLVLALGSRIGRTEVPGAAGHAHSLNPSAVTQLEQKLAVLLPGARVTVVGGGLTGIEAVFEIKERYPKLELTLISNGRVAEGWSEPARTHILQSLEISGIELLEGVRVHAMDEKAIRTENAQLPHDLCIWAAGFEFPTLAMAAGLATNNRGQVLLDPQLRSVSHQAIYVAGDYGAPVLDPGEPLPLGCKSAMPLGAHVGDNLFREITSRPLEAFDYGLLFYCVSLGRKNGLVQAAAAGGSPAGWVMTGRSAAVFKEIICKSTWWAIALEARGVPATVWRKTGNAPQALSAELLERAINVRAA